MEHQPLWDYRKLWKTNISLVSINLKIEDYVHIYDTSQIALHIAIIISLHFVFVTSSSFHVMTASESVNTVYQWPLVYKCHLLVLLVCE